jgi:hypothetical protein
VIAVLNSLEGSSFSAGLPFFSPLKCTVHCLVIVSKLRTDEMATDGNDGIRHLGKIKTCRLENIAGVEFHQFSYDCKAVN